MTPSIGLGDILASDPASAAEAVTSIGLPNTEEAVPSSFLLEHFAQTAHTRNLAEITGGEKVPVTFSPPIG